MYLCRKCKNIFSKPHSIKDNPSGIPGGEEYYGVCPHCGSFSFERARSCKLRQKVNKTKEHQRRRCDAE